MTFTEEQRSKLLITTVGKLVFNEILPESFPYMNEPTKSNIEEKTPDRFFLEKGADVKAAIAQQPINAPFKKVFWVKSSRKSLNDSTLRKRLKCLTA